MKLLYRLLLATVFFSVPGWAAIFVFPHADCTVNDRSHSGGYPLWSNLFPDESTSDTIYTQFGYNSLQAFVETIPQGNNNIFIQDPQLRNQPTSFLIGDHRNAFGTVYDPSIGLSWVLNGAFATASSGLPACPGMSSNGPLPAQFGPLGAANGQTIRLTVFPLPGSSCTATLSFSDVNGSPVGPAPLIVNLFSGQAHLDLVGSSIASAGHRVVVQPQLTNAQGCQTSVAVFSSTTGVTAASMQPQQPVYQYGFDPQGLSAGQTLRVNVSASTAQSCGAAVTFVDSNGNTLLGGASWLRAVGAGTANYVDVPSTSIPGLSGWTGGHVDVQPVINTLATGNGTTVVGKKQSGVLISETCFATAEIFDTLTGYTHSVVVPQLVN